MKKRLAIFLGVLLLGLQFANAQTRQISGTVTSSEDGMGMPGVSVVVKGTTIGTTTDVNGKYVFGVPADATALVFTFIGMKQIEMPITSNVVDAVMSPDTKEIEEVMVVAYGTVKKTAFTGSATQIGSSKIEARPISNITQALEGATPGVQVTSASGQPGSSQTIRIRGIGSVNASNDPLYVIDGSPSNFNISNLNPDDIESITVLKDAASAALYGNKAANGVILITTKKGKKGGDKLSVKFTQGFTSRSIPEYDRVNAYEYYPVMWEAYRNTLFTAWPLDGTAPDAANLLLANQRAAGTVAYAGGSIIDRLGYNPFNVASNTIVGEDGAINPNAQLLPYLKNDLDWYKPIQRTGKRSDLSVSYGGATETRDYHVSVGYTNDEGYIMGSDFERFTSRVNVNTNPKKWFKTGISLNGTLSKSNEINTGSSTGYVNPFFFARNMGPIYPVYAHDLTNGQYMSDDQGKKIYDLGNMSQLGLPSRPAGASVGRHVVAETQLNKRIAERNMVGARNYYDFMFLDGFKFSTNFNIDLYNYRFSTFDNKLVGDGSPAGRAGKTSTLTTDITLNQLLSYNKTFGKHSIDALIGHENTSYEYKYLYGFRQGLIVDGNIELINFTTTNELDSYVNTYNSEGYFSRVNYSYDNKYNVSVSYRRDGSSKFFKDSRWGDFWSVGGAWQINKESFVAGQNWIDILKLRASYGQVGNDAGIGLYAWQALYSIGYNNALEPGAIQSSLLSDGLVWESNNSLDLAVDFGFLRKVRGTIAFFNRQSSNLLFDVPLPLSSGLTSITKNIGTMYNRGIEFEVSVDPIATKDFKWTVDFNFTTFKNEITKLPQAEIISGTKKLMKGHSIYDYWLRNWVGVDERDGRGLYEADTKVVGFDPTAVDIRVIGEDTLTYNHNKAKYQYAGSAIPDFYGSIGNTFNYKNFALSIMFTYSVGGKVYDGTYASLMDAGDYGRALHTDILNRWQQPGDVTDVPRMDANATTRGQFGAASDRWLIDASYLNLRSVNFSYTFNGDLMKKIDFSSARVYISGENLMLFSKRKGSNMQQAFTGVTSNDYIPSRVITLGVNFTF